MTRGARRHCGHCGNPLRATARTDATYCSPRCKAAAARARRYRADAIRIGLALVTGHRTDVSRRCPSCGCWFIPGHGHRRDTVYDRPACRQAAYRARHQPVREAVTGTPTVTHPGTATAA